MSAEGCSTSSPAVAPCPTHHKRQRRPQLLRAAAGEAGPKITGKRASRSGSGADIGTTAAAGAVGGPLEAAAALGAERSEDLGEGQDQFLVSSIGEACRRLNEAFFSNHLDAQPWLRCHIFDPIPALACFLVRCAQHRMMTVHQSKAGQLILLLLVGHFTGARVNGKPLISLQLCSSVSAQE